MTLLSIGDRYSGVLAWTCLGWPGLKKTVLLVKVALSELEPRFRLTQIPKTMRGIITIALPPMHIVILPINHASMLV